MAKFVVKVTETLERFVAVEAEDEYEAYDIAADMYRNEEIVLDYRDHVGTDFEVFDEDEIDILKMAKHFGLTELV